MPGKSRAPRYDSRQLSERMKAAGAQLALGFREATSFDHAGARGGQREESVRTFLSRRRREIDIDIYSGRNRWTVLPDWPRATADANGTRAQSAADPGPEKTTASPRQRAQRARGRKVPGRRGC